MKKNKMMRVASFLLVAVLLSTSVISGTFAKYVVTDSAEDVARVAKFGVNVIASGALFDDTYLTGTSNPGAAGAAATTLTVVSNTADETIKGVNNKDKVAAPGTKNDTGLSIAVTGIPEVDTKLVLDYTAADVKDIFLKANSYLDLTTGAADDGFKLDADYEPITYTVKITGSEFAAYNAGKTYTKLETLLSELKTALNDKTFKANDDLGAKVGTITITWEWGFGSTDNDKQDTVLGDLAAATPTAQKGTLGADNKITGASALTVDTDYSIKAAMNLSVSIEQVD